MATKKEINAANQTIDVVGLLKAELIDLGAIFEGAKWKSEKAPCATFLAEGDEDTDDGGLTTYPIFIQSATKFGITAYRFLEPVNEESEGPVLDRDEAVKDAIAYAKDQA